MTKGHTDSTHVRLTKGSQKKTVFSFLERVGIDSSSIASKESYVYIDPTSGSESFRRPIWLLLPPNPTSLVLPDPLTLDLVSEWYLYVSPVEYLVCDIENLPPRRPPLPL